MTKREDKEDELERSEHDSSLALSWRWSRVGETNSVTRGVDQNKDGIELILGWEEWWEGCTWCKG